METVAWLPCVERLDFRIIKYYLLLLNNGHVLQRFSFRFLSFFKICICLFLMIISMSHSYSQIHTLVHIHESNVGGNEKYIMNYLMFTSHLIYPI